MTVRNTHSNPEEHRREIANEVNRLAAVLGGSSTLTLPASNTTTTISNARASRTTVPLLVPVNADAQSVGYYVSARNNGSFEITHDAPAADAEFVYLLVG